MKTTDAILSKLLRHLLYGITHGTIHVDNTTIEHEEVKTWSTNNSIFVAYNPSGRHTLTITYFDTKEKTKRL